MTMHDGTITWAQLLEETAVQHGRAHARWLCEEASGAFGEEFTDIVREAAECLGVKLGEVAQPLRAALTGRATSPGIFDVLEILGREESIARIQDQSA